MPINTLEMTKIFQTKLDEQMQVGATSGWMEANAGKVVYNGGDTVKMPEISTSGLANYDRDKGFVQGAVTLKYRDYKMTQDRGRTFHLDAMDVNESNFIASAGNVMGKFQRDSVIPEVDAYRYSKIAALLKSAGQVKDAFTPTAATILAELDAEIDEVEDIIGENQGLVIIMSPKIRTILDNADGIEKHIDVGNFTVGKIETRVKIYNELPILPVPSARMKTEYVIKDGTSSGQEAGGFAPAETAKLINWIIIPTSVPIAISKTDKIRIFEPNVNQGADAWKLDYRKFHDLWIPYNQLGSGFVNIGA